MSNETDAATRLAESITANRESGEVVETELQTDERVLARVTDGIYRRPASALRELISNAYDADAENVYISTDPPRFSRISVSDDGNGLTAEALASLIKHIGGSPKRTQGGVDLGIVNPDNTSLSPKGRKLIGKIGIGLFSVAQMTQHFQVITKVAGERFRTVADVVLKTYTEDDLAEIETEGRQEFNAGSVSIWSVPAKDVDAQGTEIVLMDLRKQTRRLLQSHERWLPVDSVPEDDITVEYRPPRYHVGRMKTDSTEVLADGPSLPWDKDDLPAEKFKRLFDAVVNEFGVTTKNPEYETTLDNYLSMLWTLALSAPLDYLDGHPFDLTGSDNVRAFLLANAPRGGAEEARLDAGQSIRERFGLESPKRGAADEFAVFVDGVQLLRPLRYTALPQTTHAIKNPIMFVGKCAPDLSSVPEDYRGGNLEFEGYLLWTPKIVPKEHNGVLVRVNDSNGVLFDETFMGYQISEQTRLRQVTAEIFVNQGLDAALNIDRESFNYAHPHYQYIAKWVHNALRQFATAHKRIASEIRSERREREREQRQEELQAAVQEELVAARVDPDEEPPEVEFVDGETEQSASRRKSGALVLNRSVVMARAPSAGRTGRAGQALREEWEGKVKALAQVLNAYGVFEDMPYKKQQDLLRAIIRVFSSGGER